MFSNSENSNYIQEFQKYIDERIKKGIQNGSNLILTGTVEKSYPGGYDIKIENSGTNSIVLATSLTKDNYTKGDFILLIKSSIINSGASIDRYFILGKVGITVKDVQTLLENQINFRIVGDTKREAFKQDGYDFKEQNQLIFSINNKDALFKDIFLLGCMQLSALFTTEQICNYGFLIEYCNKNDIVLASQKIDTNSFIGDVYFQENYPQSGIMVISEDIIAAIKSEKEEERIEIIKISLFADREEGIEIKTLFANNIAVAAGNYEKIYDKNIKVIISADKNGKDYFRGVKEEETIEDAITLVATTFFDTQELLTEDIDFYWEVKQEDKWILLNEVQINFSANINSNEINNFEKYKTKNFFILKITEKDDNYKYFQNYLTKVRCRIQYKTIESISEEFNVINYEKGNYSLSFSLKSGGSILTSTTDRVEIEAKIINNNSFIQNEELSIDWKWRIFAIEENGTVGTQNLGSSLIYDTIIIKNDEKTSIASREIEIPDGAAGVQCAVAAQLKDSNGETYLTLESDSEMPIIVRTDVLNNTEVRASTIYKYCLSSNMSLVFEEDSNSEVGWKPIDWTEYIEWKNLETRDKEGITALNNMSIGANKYLYYTQATIWEKYNKHEFLSVEKTDPWTRPQLLRYVNLAGENITGAAIEQINTFNQLTNNGKEQGIFYDESKEDGKKLYINATFIQTGTLRVGDNTDERFYASLNDSVVRIGGWGVGANELISSNQKVGLSSDVSNDNNIVIWAGGEKNNAPFRVDAEGAVYATGYYQLGKFKSESNDVSELIASKKDIDDIEETISKDYNKAIIVAIDTLKEESLYFGPIEGLIDSSNNPINAIGLKAKNNETGKGLIIFDTDQLIINSTHLKLNYGIYKDADENEKEGYIPGYFSINTNYFKVFDDGTVEATRGKIGGFHITDTHFSDGEINENGSTDDHLVMFSPGFKNSDSNDTNTYVFWAGAQKTAGDDSSRPLWITNDGTLQARGESPSGLYSTVEINPTRGGINIYGSDGTIILNTSEINYHQSWGLYKNRRVSMSEAGLTMSSINKNNISNTLIFSTNLDFNSVFGIRHPNIIESYEGSGSGTNILLNGNIYRASTILSGQEATWIDKIHAHYIPEMEYFGGILTWGNTITFEDNRTSISTTALNIFEMKKDGEYAYNGTITLSHPIYCAGSGDVQVFLHFYTHGKEGTNTSTHYNVANVYLIYSNDNQYVTGIKYRLQRFQNISNEQIKLVGLVIGGSYKGHNHQINS